MDIMPVHVCTNPVEMSTELPVATVAQVPEYSVPTLPDGTRFNMLQAAPTVTMTTLMGMTGEAHAASTKNWTATPDAACAHVIGVLPAMTRQLFTKPLRPARGQLVLQAPFKFTDTTLEPAPLHTGAHA